MMKNLLFIFAILLIGFSSCTKEEVPIYTTSEWSADVISADLTIDGTSVMWSEYTDQEYTNFGAVIRSNGTAQVHFGIQAASDDNYNYIIIASNTIEEVNKANIDGLFTDNNIADGILIRLDYAIYQAYGVPQYEVINRSELIFSQDEFGNEICNIELKIKINQQMKSIESDELIVVDGLIQMELNLLL